MITCSNCGKELLRKVYCGDACKMQFKRSVTNRNGIKEIVTNRNGSVTNRVSDTKGNNGAETYKKLHHPACPCEWCRK